LSSKSATLRQALHADLKLVPWAKTSWASKEKVIKATYALKPLPTSIQEKETLGPKSRLLHQGMGLGYFARL